MYTEKKHQIDSEIVSLRMPFVRPIVRGKSNASIEFGPKLSVNMVNGYVFMGHLSFEVFNESVTLQNTVEAFKIRHGGYPSEVHADKIYKNRANLTYCKERGIWISGPPLGRPPKGPEIRLRQRRQEREDAKIRNQVEGKRFYGLGRIMTRLADSCETVVALQLLVINLRRKLRILFVQFLSRYFSIFDGILPVKTDQKGCSSIPT